MTWHIYLCKTLTPRSQNRVKEDGRYDTNSCTVGVIDLEHWWLQFWVTSTEVRVR